VRLPAAPALACLAALAACTAAPARDASRPAPRRRDAGPRDPGFSGEDPARRGWTKVDGLLWVETAHADAFSRGFAWDGARYVSTAEPRAGAGAEWVLRTDHLVVRTRIAFARARALAADAERHVGRLLDAYGEALDLRLPADPIPVVVVATRAELARLLAEDAGPPPSWGAFYRASDGTVVACDEPAPSGALPLEADLRHELTHAVLDLGRHDEGRGEMFSRAHFWAWEAVAVHAEGLGDAEGARTGALRLARFRARDARGEVEPLATLFALPQRRFEGRHYDQLASLAACLVDDDGGARRAPFLRLLARVMAGRAEAGDFEREVGLSPAEAQRRWLAWARR
jgi:hypothetical protein